MKILIAAVIIVGIAAVGGSIIVGVISFDGIVTDHPYEKGLLWDDIQKRKAELGWRVELDRQEFVAGDNEITVLVSDRNNAPLDVQGITIMRSRRSSAAYDEYVDAIPLKKGEYRANVNFPVFGQWEIKINIMQNEHNVLFEKRIFVEEG